MFCQVFATDTYSGVTSSPWYQYLNGGVLFTFLPDHEFIIVSSLYRNRALRNWADIAVACFSVEKKFRECFADDLWTVITPFIKHRFLSEDAPPSLKKTYVHGCWPIGGVPRLSVYRLRGRVQLQRDKWNSAGTRFAVRLRIVRFRECPLREGWLS